MIKALFIKIAILVLAPIDAVAHHKPGHNPPGHQKQKPHDMTLPYIILLLEAEPEIEVRAPRQRRGSLHMYLLRAHLLLTHWAKAGPYTHNRIGSSRRDRFWKMRSREGGLSRPVCR